MEDSCGNSRETRKRPSHLAAERSKAGRDLVHATRRARSGLRSSCKLAARCLRVPADSVIAPVWHAKTSSSLGAGLYGRLACLTPFSAV